MQSEGEQRTARRELVQACRFHLSFHWGLTRDCSGDGFTGVDGYGDITGDEIFTGDITSVKFGSGEAFSPEKLFQKQSVYVKSHQDCDIVGLRHCRVFGSRKG